MEVTIVVIVVAVAVVAALVVVRSGCGCGACKCETMVKCNTKYFHYHTIKFLRHYTLQSGSLTEFDSYWSSVKFALREDEV